MDPTENKWTLLCQLSPFLRFHLVAMTYSPLVARQNPGLQIKLSSFFHLTIGTTPTSHSHHWTAPAVALVCLDLEDHLSCWTCREKNTSRLCCFISCIWKIAKRIAKKRPEFKDLRWLQVLGWPSLVEQQKEIRLFIATRGTLHPGRWTEPKAVSHSPDSQITQQHHQAKHVTSGDGL